MNSTSTSVRRLCTAAATTLLLLGGTALPTSASQEVKRPRVTHNMSAANQCILARVGTQYVRCDDLTGNGVVAPAWLPRR